MYATNIKQMLAIVIFDIEYPAAAEINYHQLWVYVVHALSLSGV